MPDFHIYVREAMVRAVEAAPDDQRRDIVAIQLWVIGNGVDARYEGITIAWNTARHLQEMRARVDPLEWPALEWNAVAYAAPEADRLVDRDVDPDGARIHERWLRDIGLWFDGEYDDDVMQLIDIAEAVNEALADVVQGLHADGTVRRLVGRDVPVFILDDLDVPEDLAKVNQRANPEAFHEQLTRWSSTWHA